MQITVKEKGASASVDLATGATAKDLAKKLQKTAPGEALAASINNELRDLSAPLHYGDVVQFISFDSAEGKEIFWHSSAHVLAQAVLKRFPHAKPTIGPAIEHGFYYDFADLSISEEDLPLIEAEMEKIIAENFAPIRTEYTSKQDALHLFNNNKYKQELITELPEGIPITVYSQGDFSDLCRGPHLPNIGKIKAVKVLKTSGAYWKGDSKNTMLTRIYGISFPEKKELKEYLTFLEESKKRDHKILGPKLDLFSLHEEAPGIPFLHPKGMIVWNRLIDFWRECQRKAGYHEIKTPTLMTKDLWVTSGHWANYRQNMFITTQEEREFALKPMNCPGCLIFYKSKCHSYRELPLRYSEVGLVHRFEPSGALSGLFRVRAFHQDDAHIFVTLQGVNEEICNVLKIVDSMYTTFGLKYELVLATRPDKQTIGSDEAWEISTNALKNALNAIGKPFRINEGDGAFYGPKIDCYIHDALGRVWQCGTIQVDYALPERFELEYIAADGSRQRPIMLHRAILGSFERFFGSLIEFYAGRFPLWLSPTQIRLVTVADRHIPFAQQLAAMFTDKGFCADVDMSNESLSKKIRDAQMNQYNYIITIGDKELEQKTLSIRTREGVIHNNFALDSFMNTIEQERASRSLVPGLG